MSSNLISSLSANLSRTTQDSKWTTNQEELMKRISEPPGINDLEKMQRKVDLKESMLISDSEDSLTRRCKRVVLRNKYERDAPEIRKWWYHTFELLEADAAIPSEEQYSVLQGIFRWTLLLKILKICPTRNKKFTEELEVVSEEDFLKLLETVRSKTSETSGTDKRTFTNVSLIDKKELKTIQEGFLTKKKTLADDFVAKEPPKCKMYTDFFKRKPSRAAVWRTLPPLSKEEMNLNQKADAVTEKIATDFIDWLKNLGGDEELSLTVQDVIEMFEVGFHANAASSLKVVVKELPSVPRKVADAQHVPKQAKRAVLRREIKRDVKASKKKTTYTAFGTHLPQDMQVRPPAENYYRKWITCDKVPENLAIMAAVWQGITHLKSTRAFCEFLLGRPEIEPPKYLADCGMMDWKTLQEEVKEDSAVSHISGVD